MLSYNVIKDHLKRFWKSYLGFLLIISAYFVFLNFKERRYVDESSTIVDSKNKGLFYPANIKIVPVKGNLDINGLEIWIDRKVTHRIQFWDAEYVNEKYGYLNVRNKGDTSLLMDIDDYWDYDDDTTKFITPKRNICKLSKDSQDLLIYEKDSLISKINVSWK